MKGRRERRYLTEKYQNKQIRIAYATAYVKPYDPDRYIRTEFARRRRFYDILCGNFVEWKTPWADRWALGEGWKTPHEWTGEDLGRLRKQSFTNCGNTRCQYCCNPRRGRHWGKKELTRQELCAELHLKEELDQYYKENYYETRKGRTTKRPHKSDGICRCGC